MNWECLFGHDFDYKECGKSYRRERCYGSGLLGRPLLSDDNVEYLVFLGACIRCGKAHAYGTNGACIIDIDPEWVKATAPKLPTPEANEKEKLK